MRRLLPAFLAAATLALLAVLWLQLPGANGPGEWRWDYRPPGLPLGDLGDLWGAAGLAVVLGGLSIALARCGLAVRIALGLGLTLAVVAAQPGGFGRVIGSLVSRHSFSYVYDAGLVPETRQLLADYPAASAGLELHSRTHPPGPLLLVRGLDRLTRGLPVAPGGLAAQAAEAMGREVSRARERHRPAPSVPPGPWAILALGFLLPAASALTAWPLHRLALRWGLPPAVASLAVLLWLLNPARSLFTPSLDQALPLLLVAAAALASPGPAGESAETPPRSAVSAVGAGVLAAGACFLSYGCLATLPWLALLALGEERLSWRPRFWRRPLLVAAGFAAPWLLLALGTGYAPWTALRTAMAAHRGMAVATRGYSTWVAWNLYDFALFLGPAILGMGLMALWPRRRGVLVWPAQPTGSAAGACALRRAAWGFWGLVFLLDLSGGVRGEVGRIWLFFMPFACLFAAAALVERYGDRWRPAAVLALLELALLLTLAANLVFIA